MSIKKYYVELVELKRTLAQLKLPKHRIMSDNHEFNYIRECLEDYLYITNYLFEDIKSSNNNPYYLDSQVNLIVRINVNNIGYIKERTIRTTASFTPLTREESKELRRIAQELADVALTIVVNPNLTDYVGTRNKFDYESIVVYLESVIRYLNSVYMVLNVDNV